MAMHMPKNMLGNVLLLEHVDYKLALGHERIPSISVNNTIFCQVGQKVIERGTESLKEIVWPPNKAHFGAQHNKVTYTVL